MENKKNGSLTANKQKGTKTIGMMNAQYRKNKIKELVAEINNLMGSPDFPAESVIYVALVYRAQHLRKIFGEKKGVKR
jgi:hypothetical protein